MTILAFESVRLDDVVLTDAPIEPSWIVDGAPVARSGQWSQSLDNSTSTWVWDCTAGTFNWYFRWDETIQIIEGEVEVTGEDGQVRVLRPGDAALFRAGTWAKWHVPTYVRKHAILRPHLPRPLWFAYRLASRFAPRRVPSSLA